jgi:hypothetical protein
MLHTAPLLPARQKRRTVWCPSDIQLSKIITSRESRPLHQASRPAQVATLKNFLAPLNFQEAKRFFKVADFAKSSSHYQGCAQYICTSPPDKYELY